MLIRVYNQDLNRTFTLEVEKSFIVAQILEQLKKKYPELASNRLILSSQGIRLDPRWSVRMIEENGLLSEDEAWTMEILLPASDELSALADKIFKGAAPSFPQKKEEKKEEADFVEPLKPEEMEADLGSETIYELEATVREEIVMSESEELALEGDFPQPAEAGELELDLASPEEIQEETPDSSPSFQENLLPFKNTKSPAELSDSKTISEFVELKLDSKKDRHRDTASDSPVLPLEDSIEDQSILKSTEEEMVEPQPDAFSDALKPGSVSGAGIGLGRLSQLGGDLGDGAVDLEPPEPVGKEKISEMDHFGSLENNLRASPIDSNLLSMDKEVDLEKEKDFSDAPFKAKKISEEIDDLQSLDDSGSSSLSSLMGSTAKGGGEIADDEEEVEESFQDEESFQATPSSDEEVFPQGKSKREEDGESLEEQSLPQRETAFDFSEGGGAEEVLSEREGEAILDGTLPEVREIANEDGFISASQLKIQDQEAGEETFEEDHDDDDARGGEEDGKKPAFVEKKLERDHISSPKDQMDDLMDEGEMNAPKKIQASDKGGYQALPTTTTPTLPSGDFLSAVSASASVVFSEAPADRPAMEPPPPPPASATTPETTLLPSTDTTSSREVSAPVHKIPQVQPATMEPSNTEIASVAGPIATPEPEVLSKTPLSGKKGDEPSSDGDMDRVTTKTTSTSTSQSGRGGGGSRSAAPVVVPQEILKKEGAKEIQTESTETTRTTTETTKTTTETTKTEPKKEEPPAPKPLPEEVAEGSTLERKTTVRYYSQMNPAKNFPLLVVISKEEIQKIQMAKVVQKTAEKAFVIKKVKPIVQIIPHFPGCICIPNKISVNVTPESVESRMWVTPLCEGDLNDARVEIWYEGKLVNEVKTPCKVTTQTITKIMAGLGFLAPFAASVLQAFELDLASQIRKDFPVVKGAFQVINFPYIAVITLLVFSALTLYFYFRARPKEADPITEFFGVKAKASSQEEKEE